jgi:hypothetical protein
MTYCHNNPETLAELQVDVASHIAADKVVQGTYWANSSIEISNCAWM